MKWIHGYSAIIFSISSLIPSIIARYSFNHEQEGNFFIISYITSIKEFFYAKETTSNSSSMMEASWFAFEENQILLFQGVSLLLAAISLMFSIFAVSQKEKSFFYATAVLISAYSIYFVNTKLSLIVIFLTFIIILNIRKKVGINT